MIAQVMLLEVELDTMKKVSAAVGVRWRWMLRRQEWKHVFKVG